MITVEENPQCVAATNAGTGGWLTQRLKCYYRETQVACYLGVPVWMIRADGERVRIEPVVDPLYINYRGKRVEIIERFVNGQRAITTLHTDESKSPHHTRCVPLELLQLGPVYSRTLNAVLCLEEHIGIAQHPHSTVRRDGELDRMYEKLLENCAQQPFTIIANDPTRRVEWLYTEVHGRICAAKVTHFRGVGETDAITVSYRDVITPTLVTHRTLTTSFAELAQAGGGILELEGCVLASHYELLAEHLALKTNRSKSESVALAYHLEQMRELSDLHKRDMQRVNDELAITKRERDLLDGQVKRLQDGSFGERAVDLQFRKLHVDERKVEASLDALADERLKAEMKLRQDEMAAKYKLYEEGLKTAGTVAKTVSVVVPVAVGLYKAYTVLTAK